MISLPFDTQLVDALGEMGVVGWAVISCYSCREEDCPNLGAGVSKPERAGAKKSAGAKRDEGVRGPTFFLPLRFPQGGKRLKDFTSWASCSDGAARGWIARAHPFRFLRSRLWRNCPLRISREILTHFLARFLFGDDARPQRISRPLLGSVADGIPHVAEGRPRVDPPSGQRMSL